MPAQMPPTRSISSDVNRTMIMSTSGAMPSWSTPTTFPVNSSGVWPCDTV